MVSGVPVITGAGLADATQFNVDVGALGHGRDSLPPGGQYFFVAVGVGPDAQQPADMVEDDGKIGNRLGEFHQLGQLVKVHPGF